MVVIDEQGENLGTLSRAEALKIAQERGVDLIEVSPFTKPPVARVMSFDKYRYQQEKKLKKQKSSQKGQELKRIQISARAAKNDLEVKARKLNEFLKDGNLVEILLVLRGREKYNRDWAMLKLKEFVNIITPEQKIISQPRFIGNGILMQVAKL